MVDGTEEFSLLNENWPLYCLRPRKRELFECWGGGGLFSLEGTTEKVQEDTNSFPSARFYQAGRCCWEKNSVHKCHSILSCPTIVNVLYQDSQL